MGSAICEHKRERYRCRECKGGGSCDHKNDKRWCRICTKVHTPGMLRKLNRCIKVAKKKPEPLKKQILKYHQGPRTKGRGRGRGGKYLYKYQVGNCRRRREKRRRKEE